MRKTCALSVESRKMIDKLQNGQTSAVFSLNDLVKAAKANSEGKDHQCRRSS